MNREKNPDAIFFEAFPKGEKITITQKTAQGLWLEKEARNKERQLMQKRIRELIDSNNPERGTKWEKTLFYEKGNLKREKGSNYKGTIWGKEFSGEGDYGDFPTIEHGRLIEGPDKGHESQTIFQRDKKGKVLVEQGEILVQGINPEKSPTGHIWEKKHFYDEKGKWRGAIGRKKNPGEEQWTSWIEGKITDEERKEAFPE